MSLQLNVFGPSDESSEVSLGENMPSDSETPGPLLEEGIGDLLALLDLLALSLGSSLSKPSVTIDGGD